MYTVGAGDVLSVSVWREPELTAERLVVSPDGTLSFPIAGTIPVAGKTVAEITDLLKARLATQLTAPIVSVALVELHSATVQVLGEVRTQAPVAFEDGLSLVEAIGAVGGPIWAYAKAGDVRIIRGALDNPVKIPVDLSDVFDGSEKDVFLKPGDIVVVPAKWVTRFDRYFSQILGPLGLGSRVGTSAAVSSGATSTASRVIIP